MDAVGKVVTFATVSIVHGFIVLGLAKGASVKKNSWVVLLALSVATPGILFTYASLAGYEEDRQFAESLALSLTILLFRLPLVVTMM